MNFISNDTRQQMLEISREYSVPLAGLIGLAGSAFIDGIRYVMKEFNLPLEGANEVPTPEEG
jgi:hypothetical protein